MISVSCGAATIYEREFIGTKPMIASLSRGFSNRANRFSISHASGLCMGGAQWIFQLQCRPQKANQFACDRGVRDTSRLGLSQFVKAFVGSMLRFPSNGDDLRGHDLLPLFQLPTASWRTYILPCGTDDGFSHMNIAGFGDAPPIGAIPRSVLAWHEAQIGH